MSGWLFRRACQTVGKSSPFRTMSVQWLARSIALSFRMINNVDRGSATDLIQINLDHPEARNALASCARSFRYLVLCPSHFPEHPEPPIQRGPGAILTYAADAALLYSWAFPPATLLISLWMVA